MQIIGEKTNGTRPRVARTIAGRDAGWIQDLIDYCGKGGGYIMATGAQVDDGREETLRAMVDFTREYGVYGSSTGKGQHARTTV